MRNVENLLKNLNSQNNINHNHIEFFINREAIKILKDNTQNLLGINNLGDTSLVFYHFAIFK